MQVLLSKDILPAILDCIEEGIHIVDSDGVTIHYNQAASHLDGLTSNEVLGVHVLEAFPSLTRKTSTLLKVLELGSPVYEQQQLYMNRKGKQIVTANKTLPLIVGDELLGAIEISCDITAVKELSEQVIDLQQKIRKPKDKGLHKQDLFTFSDIITQDNQFLQVIERAKKAALTTSPILVVGETGTGKELIIQSIHTASQRKNGPFIAQNCAAIPSSLLEGILFGTAKGAFTGAEKRPGLFQLADGGTLFLDEIQAMPIDLQAKLLRALEEKAVRRVGATHLDTIDVRVLVASNEDPRTCVEQGKLRKDLFYRINVVQIQLPSLRERKDDIPILVEHFLDNFSTFPVQEVTEEVFAIFKAYFWPGNVRELENTLEGALHLVQGLRLKKEHLPAHLLATDIEEETELSLREAVAKLEQEMIEKALLNTEGNIMQAAKDLGIPRQTLQYKLRSRR